MNQRRRIPLISHGEQAALDFVKNWFDEGRNQSRKAAMVRMAWNRMMAIGNHWNEPAAITTPGAETYHFKPVYRSGDKNLPRRTDNMIGEGIKNLTDRITRKQYEPTARANARKPELEAAAKLRRDVLIHDQRKTKWAAEIDRPLVDGIITDGPGFGRVFWDETFDQMMTLSQTTAQRCMACGTTLADPLVSIGDDLKWRAGGTADSMAIERAHSRGEMSMDGLKLGACPHCETESQLSPYNPTPDEAKDGTDFFGRRLGFEAFKGEPIWEIPSPFEMYPENCGFVSPRELKIMGQATIRSMDWVEARVDPKLCAQIQPEEPSELMKHHPTLGRQLHAKGKNAGDENAFTNHVRVFEITAQPIQSGGDGKEDGLRWGRYIRVINGKLDRNEPLMREVPPTADEEGEPRRVAISQYFVSGAREVRGQVWYRTPVDDARQLNIMLNELLSIRDDILRRGIPIVVTPDGVEWEAVRDRQSGSFNRYSISSAALQGLKWSPKDFIIVPNNGASDVLQGPIDDCRDRLRSLLGPMPVESGDNAGADSAIQLQLQAQEAAQKLNQIDEARVSIEEGMLQAYSDMIWAFRREGGEYERENEAGEFENASYDANMLLGEAKITLESSGSTDDSLLQAEKSRQAAAEGLYGDPMTWGQETKNDLLEQRGLPKLESVESVQVEKAKEAWSRFVRERYVVYIDVSIMAPEIWYQVLGKLWLGDEGAKVQREVGWEDILRKISGWDKKLALAESQDLAQRQLYEGHPPEMWGQIQSDFNAKAEAAGMAAAQASAGTGAPAPPPAVAPPPPASGQFLPDSLCERLLMLWRSMLGTQPGIGPDGVTPIPAQPLPDPKAMDPTQVEAMDMAQDETWEATKALDPVLRMYAVIQECRLEAERKQMQPTAIAAPGGAGPTGGAPSAPAPGQGVAA